MSIAALLTPVRKNRNNIRKEVVQRRTPTRPTNRYQLDYFWYTIRRNDQSDEEKFGIRQLANKKAKIGESPSNMDALKPNNQAHRIVQAVMVARAARLVKGEAEDSDALAVFGEKLARLRRKQGFKLDELAKRSNVDVSILQAIELGISSYSQVEENLNAIQKTLGDDDALELTRLLFMLFREL
jgi:hypothetical protein